MNTLVYHTGGIGDFITTLPALNYWKKEKNCHFTLLGRPHIAEICDLFEEVNDVDSKRFIPLFNEKGEDIFISLFFNKFDNVILFCNPNSALLSNVRKFFTIGNYKWQPPFPDKKIHIVDYHFSLFYPQPEKLSLSLRTPYLEFRGDQCSIEYLQKGNIYIAIHPGSGSKIKNWQYSNFIRVADVLKSKGMQILWIVGPAENSFELPKDDIIIKNVSLRECAKILKHCKLFIGNDSGISHLASAVGCKCIVIFGPSDPFVWSPRGRNSVKIIWKSPPCSPCHLITKNRQCDLWCLHSIRPEEIVEIAEELLSQKS